MNMYVNRVLITGLILISATVLTRGEADPCWPTNCRECLALEGCQWCAAETMWRNSTTRSQARCRSRLETQVNSTEAESWCPGQILDPIDHDYSMEPNDEKKLATYLSRKFVSPGVITVVTRRKKFNVTFRVKTTKTELWEHDVVMNIDDRLIPVPNTRTKIGSEKKHTTYNITATLAADCRRGEQQDVKLQVDDGYQVTVRTRRSNCGCDCGRAEEEKSEQCSAHGTLSCGGCECHSEWSGLTCDTRLCTERGDLNNHCRAPNSFVDCAGVGKCECGHCNCPKPDQFYLDDHCTDICVGTNSCALCYQAKRNDSDFYIEGYIDADKYMLGTHKCYDECLSVEFVSQVDAQLGTECVAEDEEGCTLHYVSWRDGTPKLVVGERNCSAAGGLIVNAGIGGGGSGGDGGGSGVGGIVGGVLGGLLAVLVLAGAGVMLWRAAKPEDLLAGPDYESMDPEANRGENPLYKPPTTKYINPLYQTDK